MDPRPQPARPDKIKIKIIGDVEQKLFKLACTDPHRGGGHRTLPLLADEMAVLGRRPTSAEAFGRCGTRSRDSRWRRSRPTSTHGDGSDFGSM